MTNPNDLPHPIVINFRTGKSRPATVAEAAKYKAEQEAATIVNYATVPAIATRNQGDKFFTRGVCREINIDGEPLVRFTINGEMASSKNSREVVTSRATLRPLVIKARKARDWWHEATLQLQELGLLRVAGEPTFTTDVRLTVCAFYATERPDLDAQLLKDVLQSRYTGRGKKRVRCVAGLYDNDRLVREEHYYHAIDAEHPRAEVTIERI